MKLKIRKELLHEVVDAIASSYPADVSEDEMQDIINSFIKLDILSKHGSIESYESYIKKTYGDIINRTKERGIN